VYSLYLLLVTYVTYAYVFNILDISILCLVLKIEHQVDTEIKETLLLKFVLQAKGAIIA
jgi:hypothetical protein